MARTPLARGLLTGKFKAGEPIPEEQQLAPARGDQLQLRLARVEQLRFLERSARPWLKPPCASCWPIPPCTASSPAPARLSSWNRTSPAADADLDAEERRRIDELHAAWRADGRW